MAEAVRRLPPWIRTEVPGGSAYVKVRQTVESLALHTVCSEARCPNIGECFKKGRATFLIMGDICTRNCRYCAVKQGIPGPPDYTEPGKIALAVSRLALTHAVITSVTRDDLENGGADLFALTVSEIKKSSPDTSVEILIPDFKYSRERSVSIINESAPDIINHNIEVAGSFYEPVRPMGSYRDSLELLKIFSSTSVPVKSGLMIGFGESLADIIKTLEDLKISGTSIVTIGQYLKSHKGALPVAKFYTPEEFSLIEEEAKAIGFDTVFCGAMVRSSYHAGEIFASKKT